MTNRPAMPDLSAILPQLMTTAPVPGAGSSGIQTGPDSFPLVPPGAPLPPDAQAAPTMPNQPPGAPPMGDPNEMAQKQAFAAGGGNPDAYIGETQTDGSILLRVKNPDGTPGLVVKIVSPPKRAMNRADEAARAQVK